MGNYIFNGAIYIVAIIFLIISFKKSRQKTKKALIKAWNSFKNILPLLLMFTFAIGRSVPLLVVGTFTGLLKNMKVLVKYQNIIEKVAGVILIILAGYFIWQAINIKFQFI
jgi:cytochrome c-type biogenesis protein